MNESLSLGSGIPISQTQIRWYWTRPEGRVHAVEVSPTCDGRGWFAMRCPGGCCIERYPKPELYASEDEARKAARSWVAARAAAYAAALSAIDGAEGPR